VRPDTLALLALAASALVVGVVALAVWAWWLRRSRDDEPPG
jgi:hypothetical protein